MYLLILLLPILILYPYLISRTINKYTTQKETNKMQIIKNISIIFLISIISLIIIANLLNIYDSLIPNSTSDLCTNTGGWTYSCKGDLHTAPIILLIIGLVIIIHHIFSQKFIYKIFEYSRGIFKYIYMYIHMIILYFLSFWFLLCLYGLFITVYYNVAIIELLRFLVLISPTGLFIITTIIYSLRNKKKN